jgi:putative ATPase
MSTQTTQLQPLAARMRPRALNEFIGQTHLLAPGKPLRNAIEQGKLHSMIFWGPPGTGKTTLAQIIANQSQANFLSLSAVLAGVKDIREAVEVAKANRALGKPTILFVDEVHHFNKSQQDSLLPHVESGIFTFIGATTENPSFSLNNALLSRAKVYVLKSLTQEDLLAVIQQALENKEYGLGEWQIDFPLDLQNRLAAFADGDARAALNLLDILAEVVGEKGTVTEENLNEVLTQGTRRFDNKGEDFYNQISVLHKAVRGTAPDAALYWLVRMLDGGADPRYLARRIVRMASEDIGNADPRGLEIALNAWEVQERLGSPEGELALAQAVVYLACAPKSNAVYTAFKEVSEDVKKHGSLEVPLRFRNAPTKLMKELEYGKEYRYAHDEEDGYAAGEVYLPDELAGKIYYRPVNRGLEIKIAEKLERLRKLDKLI